MTECISEGLYRIPVPLPGNPLRELNSYLLRGRERSLLIDTGFRQEEGRRALFAGLAELDVDPRDVDVALTHLHSDHSGLAPEVVGETGWIYVSGPDRAYLEQPEEAKWAHTDAFYISEGFPPELLAQNRANPARALAPVPTGRYRTLEPGAVLEAAAGSPACPRPVTPLASSASGTSRTAFSLPATTCSLTSAPISRLGTAWRTPWDAIWTACGPCGGCPPAWLCPATAAPVRWPPGWTPCWSTTPAAWTS